MKPPAPESIVVMEDHDKAYNAWQRLGVRDRILVHVDAHIDFGWLPEIDLDEIGSDGKEPSGASGTLPLLNPFIKPRESMVNIGNYICPAVRDGMVKKFYWVVPDTSWRSPRGLRHIKKQLNRLLAIKRYSGGKIELHKNYILCRIMGMELVVCGLENLERIDEPVLLDIDVDFMLTPFIWDDLDPGRSPWIFPDRLFGKLALKISDVDVLTIAYSVEGGFTPLRYKYLGDELRSLFEGRAQTTVRQKRRALEYEADKKHKDARAAYEEALRIDDTDASVYYNLFLLHLNEGDAEMAAHRLNDAVHRDKSYDTIYNNYGILYLLSGRLGTAEREYRKFLRVDSSNASVLNGLGHISLARKRYTKAGELFDNCLAVDKSHPEARLGKGIINFKKRRLAQAEQLFWGLRNDFPDDAQAYWWLGRIADTRGDRAAAIDHYKGAVMRGGEGPIVHLRLARLYLLGSFYYRALEELKRSLRVVRTLS